jgi:outer membrane protein, heavy metal efflux system
VTLVAMSVHAQESDSLLASYVHAAWANHPELASMRAMASAESSRTAMSGAWMNPELNVGLMDVPESFDTHADAMTKWQIGVMQRVPFPGKLSASRSAGRARTNASLATIDAGRNELATMVSMAYYDLASALAVRKVMIRGRELVQQTTDAATAALNSGTGSAADVLKARMELEQWNAKLVNNQADIDRARSALAFALGRRDGLVPVDPVLPDSLPPEVDTNSVVRTETIAGTPSVKKAALELEATRAESRRAKLEYWPDFSVGIAVGLRGYLRGSASGDVMGGQSQVARLKQDRMYTLEVSVPIPVFYSTNQSARVNELRAMQQDGEASLAVAQLSKQKELRDLYIKWKETADNSRISQGKVLPQAENAYQAALIDYQAGKATFMSLSEARMNVIMAETDALMQRAEAWSAYHGWLLALNTSMIAKPE